MEDKEKYNLNRIAEALCRISDLMTLDLQTKVDSRDLYKDIDNMNYEAVERLKYFDDDYIFDIKD